MKKVLVLLTAVVLVSSVQAQVKVGVKAGGNLSTWSIKNIPAESKAKFGFNAGALANISINKMFSVQPEVLFSLEGSKLETGSNDHSYNLGYVNIPVLFQYNNASGFFAETGPQLGILATARAKSGSQSQDVKSSFKSTNFSWTLGAGYKTNFGIGAGIRYSLGLTDISDLSGTEIKQSNLSVGVFYLFGGK
jgi:hypothetical protein